MDRHLLTHTGPPRMRPRGARLERYQGPLLEVPRWPATGLTSRRTRGLTVRTYLHILMAMRRKGNELTSFELRLLEAAHRLRDAGHNEFYGFLVSKDMADHRSPRIVGFGTLYRALHRLEEMGHLSSHWEELPQDATPRPRRRYYRLIEGGTQP